MELSIDTSTEVAAIALSEQGAPCAEASWTVGMEHTTQLLPALGKLLGLNGVELSSAKAVFVGLGPGSFSGVRVALSTAKGIALSLGIPIVGISTLEVEAFPFAATGLPICAVHDAGRSELAAATYQQTNGEWRCICRERLVTLGALCAETKTRTVFCGEVREPVLGELRTALQDLAVIPDSSARWKRAAHLAALGWRRLQKGADDDPATLQPIYMRRPHITVPKQQHEGYNVQPDSV